MLRRTREKPSSDMYGPNDIGLGKRFYVAVAGKTNGAHQAIVEKLRSVGQIEAYSGEDCDYFLVICPIASRVQTDITEALNKIQTHKPIILVVMHHTYNKDNIVAESRRQVHNPNVLLTVDYFFYQQKLLDCNRNEISWYEIKKFLRVPVSEISLLQTIINGLKKNVRVIVPVLVSCACLACAAAVIYVYAKKHQ